MLSAESRAGRDLRSGRAVYPPEFGVGHHVVTLVEGRVDRSPIGRLDFVLILTLPGGEADHVQFGFASGQVEADPGGRAR